VTLRDAPGGRHDSLGTVGHRIADAMAGEDSVERRREMFRDRRREALSVSRRVRTCSHAIVGTNHSGAAMRRTPGREPKGEVDRPDVRQLAVRVDPDGLLAIKRLALDLNTSVQALGVEAWNDLLKKHGKRPVVRNPLAD
jgi:hypothetical protein